jgi:hypothetical protein
MGRPVIYQLLEQAEQRIAAIDQRLMHQRRIVEKLRALGADTWGAQALLNDLQDVRRIHVRYRDRLREGYPDSCVTFVGDALRRSMHSHQ